MAIWQIILITLYAGFQILDELTLYTGFNTPVGAGFVVGLIMGDLQTGLMIGAGMQLMVLGVGTFGGASKIDATIGTTLATAFSVSVSGMSPQVAISSIAVPVAAIMVQLDILAELTTTLKLSTTKLLNVTSYTVLYLGHYQEQFLYLSL